MKPTERFSSRVENYAKYRPSYPPQILDLLREKCKLSGESIIADVGSGTGIFTALLLKNKSTVFAVEPNQPMRETAEKSLGSFPNFRSLNGTAETIPLPDRSVDFITAAQAFHWFHRNKTRPEFLRVLKPGGWLVLIWNDRRADSTPFLKSYEALLQKFGTDYQKVNHRHIDDQSITDFFAPAAFQKAIFFNEQRFDYEGLKGRLLSSSYVPAEGHPDFDSMLDELKHIFEKHQRDDAVTFEYDTLVYFGQLS